MSHHIIEANGLYFKYPDGKIALDGVSLRISHGESVALVGANGAGKSTLLLHFNGYLMPEEGTVHIGEALLTRKNLHLVRRSVGMVFQNPDDQLFMPTVFEDVAFGPVNLGLTKTEVQDKVLEALKVTGVEHLSKRPPYKLSQGEKRAVSIAAVLAVSPDILVMDEPTSSLDPRSRRQLIELLRVFRHSKIIATHDLDMAAELCERTIVLHKGKVVADGLTQEIFHDESLLKSCGLEKPLSMQGCPVCSK